MSETDAETDDATRARLREQLREYIAVSRLEQITRELEYIERIAADAGIRFHLVAGVIDIARGMFGVRVFQLNTRALHSTSMKHLEDRLRDIVPMTIAVSILTSDTMRCFVHEDCEAAPGLGRACWLSRYPQHRNERYDGTR